MEGERAERRPAALHRRGQAARVGHLDRAPRRPRAHVLRVAAAERTARLDADAARHDQPARAVLHGRDLRVLPAGGEPAVEGPAADAAEAGPRVRPRVRAGDAEPRGHRLQGPVERRHVVARPAADRARQGARARGARRRGDGRRRELRPRVLRQGLEQPALARVRDEQRARGSARRDRVALGDVVPARAADAGPDPAADGAAQGPGGVGRAGRPAPAPAASPQAAPAPRAAGRAVGAASAAPGAAARDPAVLPAARRPRPGPAPRWRTCRWRLASRASRSPTRRPASPTRASLTLVAEIDPRLGSVAWADATPLDVPVRDLASSPEGDARFGALPPAASKAKTYDGWAKELKTWLGQSQTLDLLKSSQTGAVSAPGESERDFRIRLQTATREQRDQALDALRKKYAAKIAALDEKIRRAQLAVDRESEQASQQKLQTAVSFGRHRARRALRPQGDEHVDAGPGDDGGARHGPDDEGEPGHRAGEAEHGGRAAAEGRTRGADRGRGRTRSAARSIRRARRWCRSC